MRVGFDLDYDLFSPLGFFADLLVLCIVLVPLCRRLGPAWRRWVLVATGAYLLFTAAPRLLLFYAAFWLLVWTAQRLLSQMPPGPARGLVFAAAVASTLAPVVIWKLWPLQFVARFNVDLHGAVAALSRELGESDFVHEVFIPVGLSFAAFRAVDLLVQTLVGLVEGLPLREVLFFGFFPPVLVVGPLVEYRELREVTGDAGPDIAVGLQRILVGLFKVLVLAWPLGLSLSVLRHFSAYPVPVLLAWTAVFAWAFYLNFSGYSDLALGTARLFSFRLAENFDFPFLQPDLQGFWASWHMSLTRMAQRNVFVPLGGMRRRWQYPALIATMLAIALWHDISWSMVAFGLYHGLGLCARRALAEKGFVLSRGGAGGRLLPAVVTFGYVAASLPLLALPVDRAWAFYSRLLP